MSLEERTILKKRRRLLEVLLENDSEVEGIEDAKNLCIEEDEFQIIYWSWLSTKALSLQSVNVPGSVCLPYGHVDPGLIEARSQTIGRSFKLWVPLCITNESSGMCTDYTGLSASFGNWDNWEFLENLGILF